MDTILKLVAESYTTSATGQTVSTKTETEIFCDIKSVSRAEFFAAGNEGLKPSYVATIFAPEYNGEKIAKYGNKSYGIYRTYQKTDDELELYLEEKTGI